MIKVIVTEHVITLYVSAPNAGPFHLARNSNLSFSLLKASALPTVLLERGLSENDLSNIKYGKDTRVKAIFTR